MSEAWARFAGGIEAAAAAHNQEQARTLVNEVVDRLHRGSAGDVAAPAETLRLLRGQRWFELVELSADALIQAGFDAPVVRRHLIQALLDRDSKTAAMRLIEELIRDTENKPNHLAENAEAWGLRGRAFKQLYVEADAGSPEHLRVAIESYHRIYQRNREHVWHGINAVALLRRAADDGVDGGAIDDQSLAEEILETIEGRRQSGEVEPWDLATAGEASLAVEGGTDAALGFMGEYARSDVDAFALAGTLRQLEEVWRLTATEEPGRHLLPLLRAALLAKAGGGVEAEVSEAGFEGLAQMAEPGARFEAILGREGFEQVVWFQTAMERAKSVAIVETRMGQPQGTAFVMRAGDLSTDITDPDTLVLVTNEHVVSDAVDSAVHPDDAVFRFELAKTEETFEVDHVRWSSPKLDLDITVVVPRPALTDAAPIPLARGIPRLEERVYVIGHPGGRRLSFSLYDNRLLNYAKPLLHYRTPTEGGNSGSPVFNKNWELIGLHHVGGTKTRVPNEEGLQPANEGISFEAICERRLGEAD